MCGETVPQSMRMHSFVKVRPPGGSGAGMPNGFRIDRPVSAMVVPAGKEPDSGAPPQTAPVLTKFFEQFEAEHDVTVFASFGALDVNDHPLLVEVAEF